MLFNEPKLLKSDALSLRIVNNVCFSALQRAEIAEIVIDPPEYAIQVSFSALQRAEIAEIVVR